MIGSISEDVVILSLLFNLLVKYYMVNKIFEFQKLFREEYNNSKIISVKINWFSKCKIGLKIFGSNILIYYIKSLYILAKFII